MADTLQRYYERRIRGYVKAGNRPLVGSARVLLRGQSGCEELSRVLRVTSLFSALVVTQAAHSIEEYAGRLWESFPPARFLSGLVSSDREVGFIIINTGLVLFGLWCLVFPVRREWRSAPAFIWFWIGIETMNGIGHPLWSIREGGYTPGVLTAPILLVIALYLAKAEMRSRSYISPSS